MIANSINFELIKKELENNLSIFDYRLNKIYIDYLKNYYSMSTFEDVSFIIKIRDSKLYCPLTIEKKIEEKKLNFFGEPFFIICNKISKEVMDKFYLKLREICSEWKVKEINLVLQLEKTIENLDKDFKINSLNKICHRKYIDLTSDFKSIKEKFSRGLKNKINKQFDELDYEIIDHKNYDENKNDILVMMKMHEEISNKSTRSKKTWLLNGEMIKNNNGLLVKVTLNKKIISYFFVIYTKTDAYYFSSCTYREYFSRFSNITHKSVIYVLKYLIKIGCKTFTLGDCKTIYSSGPFSEKEKSIQQFKNSFGGSIYTNYYFRNLDQNFSKFF